MYRISSPPDVLVLGACRSLHHRFPVPHFGHIRRPGRCQRQRRRTPFHCLRPSLARSPSPRRGSSPPSLPLTWPIRLGKENTSLHAESGGNVLHLAVVGVYVAESRTVRSESATKNRKLTKVRLRNSVCSHTEIVVLLREFGLLSSNLRLIVLVGDLPTFDGACGSDNLGQHWQILNRRDGHVPSP